jgi:hypothetical protein
MKRSSGYRCEGHPHDWINTGNTGVRICRACGQIAVTTYKLTASNIREIVARHGLSHAEFVLDQAESQLGTQSLKQARDEWKRLLTRNSRRANDYRVCRDSLSRRLSSASIARRIKAERNSPPFRTRSIRSPVPSGRRAVMCSFFCVSGICANFNMRRNVM